MRLIYYWLIHTRPSYVTTLASTWWFVIDLFLPWPYLWFHSGLLLFFPDHRVCWPVREISTETCGACGTSVWPDHCWQLPVLDWLAGKHAVIKGNLIDREFFSLTDWLMNWMKNGWIDWSINKLKNWVIDVLNDGWIGLFPPWMDGSARWIHLFSRKDRIIALMDLLINRLSDWWMG